MTGDLIINGKDAWDTWGVRMGDGFIDAIDGFNEMKEYITNESRLEDGKRVITSNAKVASRQITLQFTIEGSSESDYRAKKKAFQTELEKGSVNIKVPSIGSDVYKLIYLGKSLSYGLVLDDVLVKCRANSRNRTRKTGNNAQFANCDKLGVLK